MKPCARLKRPNITVSTELVDHTRRKTRGRLAKAAGTLLMLNFSFASELGPPDEEAMDRLIV